MLIVMVDLLDYSIVRIRERFVGMYTLRLGVLARDLEELRLLMYLLYTPPFPSLFSHNGVYLITL